MKLIGIAILALAAPLFAAADSSALLRATATRVLDEAGLTTEKAAGFREAFLGSEVWQHEFFDSGQVADPTASMATLHALWESDPAMVEVPVDRGMATACALEGPVKKWDAARMTGRYEYFRDNWKVGLLNEMYGNLSVFERRYLANGVQHDRFNSLESMNYQLEEVCLPADQYTGACWYARWIAHNAFGDSVQGPHYYEPFEASWDSPAEMVRHVGGVCGSLSNFGAAAAIANGIPAATMGEPGHCAHVIMIRPQEWVPAYSLSWSRGLHHSFYGTSWSWHLYNTRSQNSTSEARESGDMRREAGSLRQKGSIGEAIAAYRKARSRHPLDYANWLESAELLRDKRAPEKAWHDLHADVLKHLAPEFPEVAWDFLSKEVYPAILPKGEDELRLRQDVLLSYHRAISGWGAARWNLTAAVKKQMSMVSKKPVEQDEFAVAVFGIHAEQAELVPTLLEAQFAVCGKDEERKQAFIHRITEGLGKSNGRDFGETIGVLAAKILPSAAASGDKATFQFLGELASKSYEPCDVKVENFPGILLSSGGTLAIAKPGNRWDVPTRHWGVIEEHGGDFHTDAAPAFATVQLGNYGRLSGVVIVQRGGNLARLNGAKLQVSTDGTSWTDVHTFTQAKRVERIDLADRKLDAGYVRVLQENGPHLHFNRFLVYGAKQN
ncbi:hypothetical protein HAHE_19420 [Haloferula helveola]|uniref:F5/8 type C domain-containing protein n=1 Tax=Haloferula helveola TaxID=490095 RepID=A0ABM7RLN0_9BACT|nr:hypothetical protein HAHE_19420 [Haloferula helveola]